MLADSLFICCSTPNYATLTDNLLESLQTIGVTNINHQLVIPNEELMQCVGFQSDLWYFCLEAKIKHLINVISEYKSLPHIKYFIFCDCDVWFIKNNLDEWRNLEYIINGDKDVYFMRECVSDDVNTGMYIIKNNNMIDIISFFNEVAQILSNSERQYIPLGDQTIINNLKYKLNYGIIPNDYVVFGNHIFNNKKTLFHHAVCCRYTEEKMIQINNIKLEFRPKLCILIIYSHGPHYEQMIEIQRQHYAKYNIHFYFVKHENMQSDIELIGDTICVNGVDSKLNILKKTVNAMQLLSGKFDYFIRTNVSTIINVSKLYDFIETVPFANYYGSANIMTLNWLDYSSGIMDDSLFGTVFAQGTSIILSKDIANSICNGNLRHDIVDDIAIAIYINAAHKEAMDNLLKYQPNMSKHIDIVNFPLDFIFFRNRRHELSPLENRDNDILAMKYVCANIKL